MSKKHCKKEQKQLIKLLTDHGWSFAYQRGGHKYFIHPKHGDKITIPVKITKNIELSIRRQAGLKGVK